MTNAQKILISKILTGHFLRMMKRKDKSWYVLYDAKINPVLKVNCRTVDKIDQFIDPKLKLWKKNKQGDISLNLRTVVQLHGRSTIKRMYKQRHSLNSDMAIYKSRNHQKKIKTITANEKALYLF